MKVEELQEYINQYVNNYKQIRKYEVLLRENGEYGSFVDLPIQRVEVSIDEGKVFLVD